MFRPVAAFTRRAMLGSAAAVLAGGAVAFGAIGDNFGSPSPPLPGPSLGQQQTATVTGSRQGVFTSPPAGPGARGAPGLPLLAVSFGRRTPVDVGSGLPTGRVACQPIDLRMAMSNATAHFYSAESTNEILTSVVFREFRSRGHATQFYALTLSNALVTGIHTVDSSTTGAYDDISLTYQHATLAMGPHGPTTAWDCQAPG